MASVPYPDLPAERDRWVVSRRGAKPALDPARAGGWLIEEEVDPSNRPIATLTVFLTNRECPWRCVYCDLWRYTLDRSVAPGRIPGQLDQVLGDPRVRAAEPRQVKLYNAGSFFDAGAIPPEDDPALAERVGPFERVVVESHPALIGDRCWRWRDRLAGTGTAMEVAMGLETANPAVVEMLNKRVGLDGYARAAAALRGQGVSLRSFVLVQPPFEEPGRAVEWAVRSAAFAFECGARMVAMIPTRPGNGALEALRESGRFRPPTLATLEDAVDGALALGRGQVVADLWDLETFRGCVECFRERRDRLHRQNLGQTRLPRILCRRCGAGMSA